MISFIFDKYTGTGNENEIRAINLQGILLREEGKYKEAIEKYKEAVGIDDEFAPAYSNWGFALYKKEPIDYREVFKNYKKAADLDPGRLFVYYRWGLLLDKLGYYGGAIKKYKKFIVLNPGRPLAYYGWALTLHKQGKYEEAFKKHEKGTRLDPIERCQMIGGTNPKDLGDRLKELIERDRCKQTVCGSRGRRSVRR